MAISKEEFRAALSRFASGVTVVTTKDAGGKLYGITVSAFCSVSLVPPLVLICVERTAGSHRAVEQSRVFVVNVLGEDQQHISDSFASRSNNKFSGIRYRTGIEDLPVFEDALVSLECRLRYSHEGGDHTIFVGEIEKATIGGGGEKPLLYFHGNYRKLND